MSETAFPSTYLLFQLPVLEGFKDAGFLVRAALLRGTQFTLYKPLDIHIDWQMVSRLLYRSITSLNLLRCWHADL
jgi:hypothetical protein